MTYHHLGAEAQSITFCEEKFDSLDAAIAWLKGNAPALIRPDNFVNEETAGQFLEMMIRCVETGASLFEENDPAAPAAPAAGINPKDALGAAKPNLSLVPPAAMLHLASAMMDGAAKYGPYNWRENAVQAMIYVAAAQRHLSQFLDGENFDPISKVHHLGHAMACCAILLDALETGNLVDNRPVAGQAGEMIRRWTGDTKFGFPV